MTTILHVNSSGRQEESASRLLSAELVEKLAQHYAETTVIKREAIQNAEFLEDDWIAASFTPQDQRSIGQINRLQNSQLLVDEVRVADILVIGMPIYNFSISGVLKTWIDQICRPGLTFRAEPTGFVGLLENKKVYLVVTSGGTDVNGPIDFATGYMVHILSFLGIDDVSVISADTMMSDPDGAIQRARKQIDDLPCFREKLELAS